MDGLDVQLVEVHDRADPGDGAAGDRLSAALEVAPVDRPLDGRPGRSALAGIELGDGEQLGLERVQTHAERLADGVVELHLEDHLEVVGALEHGQVRQVVPVPAEQQHAVEARRGVPAVPTVPTVFVLVLAGHGSLRRFRHGCLRARGCTRWARRPMETASCGTQRP